MKKFSIPLLLFLTSTLLGSCTSVESQPEKKLNALIIQADFAGLVMTGVAYSVDQDLDIFDVRPLIDLYDIAQASGSLAYNAQTWPPGTVFVSVVDPGVGTSRKSVVLKTKSGHYFVSPDNGSLSGPAERYGISAVREIDESVNRRPDTDWSHTFHGRDVYAYTGARLAAGVISFEEVGPLLDPAVMLLEVSKGKFQDGQLTGLITGGTGRLGNISLNIDRHLFEKLNVEYGDTLMVTISQNDKPVWDGAVPYARSFGSVEVGENLLFINSSGDVSIAVNQGSFAGKYGIGSGSDWHITIRKQ